MLYLLEKHFSTAVGKWSFLWERTDATKTVITWGSQLYEKFLQIKIQVFCTHQHICVQLCSLHGILIENLKYVFLSNVHLVLWYFNKDLFFVTHPSVSFFLGMCLHVLTDLSSYNFPFEKLQSNLCCEPKSCELLLFNLCWTNLLNSEECGSFLFKHLSPVVTVNNVTLLDVA